MGSLLPHPVSITMFKPVSSHLQIPERLKNNALSKQVNKKVSLVHHVQHVDCVLISDKADQSLLTLKGCVCIYSY